MAVITHRVKLEADAKSAIAGIREYEDRIVATARTVDAYANRLDGSAMFKAANNWTAAVGKLGGATGDLVTQQQLLAGASKLTDAEQARLNRTLGEAIEKYQKLGLVAPSAMRELHAATAQAHEPMAATPGLLSKIGPAMVGAFSVTAITGFGKALLDTADELVKVSDRTGMTTDAVQRLQYIGSQTSVQLDSMTTAIGQMQNRLASGDASAVSAVRALGMSMSDLLAMSPDQQFIALGSAIGQVEDPARRSQLAMDLFGKGGLEVLPAIVSNMKELANQAPVMSAAAIEGLDAAGDAMARLWIQAKNLAGEGLGKVITAVRELNELGNRMNRGDVEGVVNSLFRLDTVLPTIKEKTLAVAQAVGEHGASMELLAQWSADLNETLGEQQKKFDADRAAADALTESLEKFDQQQRIAFWLGMQKTVSEILPNFEKRADAVGDMLTGNLLRALQATARAELEVARMMEQANEVIEETPLLLRKVPPEMTRTYQSAQELSRQFYDMGQAMGQIASEASPELGRALSVLGGSLSVILDPETTDAQKWASGVSAALSTVGQAVSSLAQQSNEMRVFGSVLQGAGQGAASGGGWGALIGAVIGGISSLISIQSEAKAINQQYADSMAATRARLEETYGSLTTITRYGRAFNTTIFESAVASGYGKAGFDAMSASAKALEYYMGTLNSSLEAWGYTWRDLNSEMQNIEFTKEAQKIAESLRITQAAGLSSEKAIKGSSAAMNQLLIDAATTGQQIPGELRPALEQMIKMGLVTDDAARAMLGLSKDTTPSLADIQAAAERYGMKLDELGGKVPQLRITEQASQIEKDWKTLTDAGIPFSDLMKDIPVETRDASGKVVQSIGGMRASTQAMVTQALKMGLELPASMQPFIEKMIEGGYLTDDTGTKISDTSKLKFAPDLPGKIDELITKLGELIGKMIDPGPTSVAGSFVDAFSRIQAQRELDGTAWGPWADNISNHARRATSALRGVSPGFAPPPAGGGYGGNGGGGGGGATPLAFASNTFGPAIFSGSAAFSAPTGGNGMTQTIIVQVGEDVIARAAVRGMPRQFVLQGR